jgi:8-oxo-dGTP pyrophosphatase MutT (NUDIX family)
MIEAAGGVIWRINDNQRVEVILIHRSQRQDWSLPKGKLRRTESARRGASREVREETGFRCEFGPELPETRYVDNKGRDKRVRYWAMQVRSGRFRPNREVDFVRWFVIEHAIAMLTYDHDRDVVAALSDTLALV